MKEEGVHIKKKFFYNLVTYSIITTIAVVVLSVLLIIKLEPNEIFFCSDGSVVEDKNECPVVFDFERKGESKTVSLAVNKGFKAEEGCRISFKGNLFGFNLDVGEGSINEDIRIGCDKLIDDMENISNWVLGGNAKRKLSTTKKEGNHSLEVEFIGSNGNIGKSYNSEDFSEFKEWNISLWLKCDSEEDIRLRIYNAGDSSCFSKIITPTTSWQYESHSLSMCGMESVEKILFEEFDATNKGLCNIDRICFIDPSKKQESEDISEAINDYLEENKGVREIPIKITSNSGKGSLGLEYECGFVKK